MHYPPNATWVLFVNEIVLSPIGACSLTEAATTPNPNPMLRNSLNAIQCPGGIALLLLGGFSPLIAQVDITGSITDGATGEPLIGTTVIQKNYKRFPTPVSMVRSR